MPQGPPAPPTTYPLVLTKLAQVRCLVVGGGTVAERKVAQLLEGGARPLVISPQLTATLERWHNEGRVQHLERPYRKGDLASAFLVIAATNDPHANTAVAAEGEALGVLVNVVDAPQSGNFHTTATLRRGDLLLSVSTGGASPALAAHIQTDLANRFGPEYAQLLKLLRDLREGPAKKLSPDARRNLWRALFSKQVVAALTADPEAAEGHIQSLLHSLQLFPPTPQEPSHALPDPA